MRRLVLEEPMTRSAVWSRNLALFSLIVAMIGIVLSHKGLDARASLSIEGGALGLAALGALFALFALAMIWRTGYRGIGLALQGLVVAALLFAYPAYLSRTHSVPTLVDASTDLDDPPRFTETGQTLAARHGYVPPARPQKADAALQETLAPDLQTLDLDADVGDVLTALTKLIKRRKWSVVAEVRPEHFATGHVDMVVKAGLMGFPSDVTVRLRGIGSRTRVDIRSTSRSPWQEDPTANADRVQTLSDDLESAVGEG